MSFENTYVYSILIALDDFGAALLFNRNDCTISSLCRLAQLDKLAPLKLSAWQVSFLKRLAPMLDRMQANHCEIARLEDIRRGNAMAELLDVVP